MIRIFFPAEKPKLKTEGGVEKIFCPIRKKWLKVIPEEWVRQNIILYLHLVLGYPLALIAVEKGIQVGELKKRFDVVVYNRDHQPYLLIECKEMKVPLSEDVLEQVLAYNTVLRAAIIVVTNGLHCAAVKSENGKPVWLSELPLMTDE
ncbi:MAG: type I restriction enzyme HsdR N-terminal domain-containing protein [Bacteroidetes bacterium]|nr:type I restriction enzyme HsdR N-terminal domain-containing protein [Bacteroidota bacterium]